MRLFSSIVVGSLAIAHSAGHADVTHSAAEAYEAVQFAGEYPGRLYRQAIDGNTMAMLGDRLRVFSIDDPTSPIELGSVGGLQTGSYPQIDIASDWVAINSPSALTVVDISDPSMPTVSSTHPSGGYFTGAVEIHGDIVYYASAGLTNPGIQMIDLSVPGGAFIGVIPSTESVTEFTIVGSVLYAIHESGAQFKATDIQDPFNPIELSSLACIVDDGWWDPVPYSFAHDAGLISLQTGNGLELIDFTDPMNPATRSVLTDFAPFHSRVLGSVMDGDVLYTSNVGNVIDVYDMGVDTAPVHLNEIVIPYFQYARLARTPSGVLATGLTDDLFYIEDTAPNQQADRLVAEVIPDARFHEKSMIDGSMLYTTSYEGSTPFLNVFSLDDPQNPVHLATHQLNNIRSFPWAVHNSVFYMVRPNANRLIAYDVSDPMSLANLDTLLGISGENLVRNGSYLYGEGTTIGQIHAISIADPSDMVIVDSVTLPDSNLEWVEMRLYDEQLAVRSSDLPTGGFVAGRLTLFDVSDPSILFQDTMPMGLMGPGVVAIAGDSFYVHGDTSGGMDLLPLSHWQLVDGVAELVWDEQHDFIAQYGPDVISGMKVFDDIALSISDNTIFAIDLNDTERLRILASIDAGLSSHIRVGSLDNGRLYQPVLGGVRVYQVFESTTQCSAADLNSDGYTDFFDVSVFLSLYNAMDPQADFNGDGQWNFFDVSLFLTAFQNGCP